MRLPEHVEAILADFRHWMADLTPTAASGAPAAPADVAGFPDVYSLVAQFTALRQDVNMQTRATRAATEQVAEALKLAALPSATPDPEEIRGPLLKVLVDVADALALALRQVERTQTALGAILDDAETARTPPPGWWARRFRRGAPPPAGSSWDRLRPLVTGLATGYAMSLQRVDRGLLQFGLEPVECVGRPFDPERMEAVEVVDGAGRPSGTVVEDVRRGYSRNGTLFRTASVRVAR